MSKQLFHIQPKTLSNIGFERNVDFDKNLPTDDFDTLQYESFTKKIGNGISLEITYTRTAKIKGVFELDSAAVEFHINESFAPINVNTLVEIRQLIKILEGHGR